MREERILDANSPNDSRICFFHAWGGGCDMPKALRSMSPTQVGEHLSSSAASRGRGIKTVSYLLSRGPSGAATSAPMLAAIQPIHYERGVSTSLNSCSVLGASVFTNQMRSASA
jgi:hypothetical protein